MPDRLGLPPLINACGPVTRLGGGIMHPDVAAAMADASRHCFDMLDLQAAACRAITRATGAQAGIVTSGASAAILLGAAACLAGLDPGRMNRLPDVPDGKRQIVIVRSQRNMYDRAMVLAGAALVEIGIPDRVSGPGVRDAAPWEIEDAIGPATAAIYYLAQRQSQPTLGAVAAIARRHGIPVLVDAAAQLPPASNLGAFLDQGADLVAFSGGKAIGGPQASGILCGRADLVSSALAQMLDLDLPAHEWDPPAEFAPLRQMRGLPHHGIGRSCKAGKEEIAGLVAALERFAAEDPAARHAGWLTLLHVIMDAAGATPGLRVLADHLPAPLLELRSPAAPSLAASLRTGSPRIECLTAHAGEGVLLFSPASLTTAGAAEIGRRLAAATASAQPHRPA